MQSTTFQRKTSWSKTSCWWLFPFICASLVSSSQAQCTLNCQNSQCVQGNANFSDHVTVWNETLDFHDQVSDANGYHCACSPGWTGLECDRPFTSCGDGTHKCYHGGNCIAGLEDIYSNEQLFCDCSSAMTGGIQYAGKYCENPVLTLCDNSTHFCMNGGVCQTQPNPLGHCNCGDGWTGAHCEFAEEQVPTCDLECEHDGLCVLGILQDFADDAHHHFWGNHSEGQHCVCPDGYFGLQCEVTHEQCNEDVRCYNGGTCIQTSDGNHYCDCRTAADGDTLYGGRFCQYQASAFCGLEPDHNGHHFCFNNGLCEDTTVEGCDCPEGYSGPMCEFHESETETLASYADCSTDCGPGSCRKGARDGSSGEFLGQFGDLNLNTSAYNHNFEHCICPDNFIGEHCEIQLDSCDGGNLICLHGSTCQEQSDGSHRCRCEDAWTPDSRFAGEHCQHHHTDVCTANGLPGSIQAPSGYAFCTNDGVCRDRIVGNEDHPGCDCPPGYGGPHCELYDHNARQDSSGDDGIGGGGIAFLTIFGALVIVVCILLLIRAKETSRAREMMVIETMIGDNDLGFNEPPGSPSKKAELLPPSATTQAMTPPRMASRTPSNTPSRVSSNGHTEDSGSQQMLDVGPPKDLEGNELEDVAIV